MINILKNVKQGLILKLIREQNNEITCYAPSHYDVGLIAQVKIN